ncbi:MULTISPECIES: helix-turn-helix domain-containing protein [unclassified Granulicatella]|uniref:helix-turn-helix domain-containing protein n=1 Tax=unclassified Granulicatella TaxID=2630493 RepID=UPI001073ED7F|nr:MULTISPECIES: helix-turn-helix domain-containing protein [unclassified Granulicatella]MBF0780403.1 helix-turn-helix domain-containing protein [Granulicatella sp. 19428wC4_WM01]TFU95442.1 helix-turn-helix domain-containing protein [Granulicatella sp. WM01]
MQLDINTVILILFGLSAFFLFLSLFTKNSAKRDIEELKDYSFEQSQELYRLRERISSLETFTGLPATQTFSFTSELRSLSELTKENIISLYSEGRTPEEISIFANIPIETVQILIDRYIEESTK